MIYHTPTWLDEAIPKMEHLLADAPSGSLPNAHLEHAFEWLANLDTEGATGFACAQDAYHKRSPRSLHTLTQYAKALPRAASDFILFSSIEDAEHSRAKAYQAGLAFYSGEDEASISEAIAGKHLTLDIGYNTEQLSPFPPFPEANYVCRTLLALVVLEAHLTYFIGLQAEYLSAVSTRSPHDDSLTDLIELWGADHKIDEIITATLNTEGSLMFNFAARFASPVQALHAVLGPSSPIFRFPFQAEHVRNISAREAALANINKATEALATMPESRARH